MSEILDKYKSEYSFDGNSITHTVMQMMSGGKWYYKEVSTEYYDNEGTQTGYFSKNYICQDGMENVVNNAYGNRSLTYTENGTIINKIESYDQDTDMWNCTFLVITSENYDDPYIYKPGVVRFEEYYYDTNGDGILDSNDKGTKYVITWVKDRIMKVEYNDDTTMNMKFTIASPTKTVKTTALFITIPTMVHIALTTGMMMKIPVTTLSLMQITMNLKHSVQKKRTTASIHGKRKTATHGRNAAALSQCGRALTTNM